MAAILVAEIGDVRRFRSAAALCSWAGLTPKHKESDTTVHRGQLTKQGSRLVRWAVVEDTVRYHCGGKLAADFRKIAERRGKHKATIAIARKELELNALRRTVLIRWRLGTILTRSRDETVDPH
jgi:transposase